MIIRTTCGFCNASTFAQLAAWQNVTRGTFPDIEIGAHSVDVTGAETAEDMAALVSADEDIIEALQALSVEAQIAGDGEMVALCERTLRPDIEALEACCAAICDAYGA